MNKLRENAEYRLGLIEEFKKTLENIEWKESVKESERQQRHNDHLQFVSKLMEDKMFKQEMTAF